MKSYENYRDGLDTAAPQKCWDYGGFSCDLCRCEVRYFEYMWHCGNKEHVHDLCLSCMYSNLQQYKEMKKFLVGVLDKVVNRDIIEEIVVFCVGKVNKFDR